MLHKILLVDIDAEVTNHLGSKLREAGFQVIVARDATSAMAQAIAKKPSLIVLDLDLPQIPGFEVCRRLQAEISTRHIPFIILTAFASENHRILGFELGADDYVTKPFSAREVILRIKKSLERAQYRPEQPKIQRMTLGPLTLDRTLHQITLHDEPVHLTPIEFKLLAVLMERHGCSLGRDALLDVVWGLQSNPDSRTVDSHVKRLRAKLGYLSGVIETMTGFGYRLNENLIPSLEATAMHPINSNEMDLPIERLQNDRVSFPGSKKRHAGVLALK